MEKLIELLNEYEVEKNGEERRSLNSEGGLYCADTPCGQNMYGILICAKPYGFIKWLVENDKIDNKKIADETYVKVNGEWYELILGCHYDLYQQTLMLLSISDTPIEDLISYLK